MQKEEITEIEQLNFLIRCDFFTKFGGDTYQIEQYVRYLPKNISVQYMTTKDLANHRPSEQTAKVAYVLVNIDKMYDASLFQHQLQSLGIKNYYVVPIHHSLKHIDAFNSFRTPKLIKSLFKLNTFKVEAAKGILSEIKNVNLPHFQALFNLKSNIRKLLTNSKGLIFIANGERCSTYADFAITQPPPSTIIRNAVSEGVARFATEIQNQTNKVIRDVDVLVCGRIEQRKNQLFLANLFKNTDLKIFFVGSLNANNEAYCQDFLKIIGNAKNLDYISGVSPEKIPDYFIRSKIHLSASHFEVSSLVDIEAMILGCYCISSKNGFSFEMFEAEDGFTCIDPNDGARIMALVREAIESFSYNQAPYCRTDLIRTWEQASIEFYEYVQS